MTNRIVAVDLGASSGRVYVADVAADHFSLAEAGRFTNGAVQLGDRLYWDILALHRGVVDSLTQANRGGTISSIGVDSWAVDYGLVRKDGTLLSNPACYRDARTKSSIQRARELVGQDELFRRTGIAHQPFNTVFQLMADRDVGNLAGAPRALLIPDLLNYFLTGNMATEVTNASTTQLLSVNGEWDEGLFRTLNLDLALFPELVSPGHLLGMVREDVIVQIGAGQPIRVVNVASHDTASAVLAVPATTSNFAYISCGTWSLVGMEIDTPIVTESARLEGFSNERGMDETFRFLHNVMGLWLLQESIRVWERQGNAIEVNALVARCEFEQPLRSIIDINDEIFLAPGDMPSRISDLCRRGDEPVPETPEQVTRCILDSLAMAYRLAVRSLEALTGRTVEVVHIVGGGVNNKVLCQLTSDACGIEVIAGPVEAAAIGNILVQAKALDVISGDRWALRNFLARNQEFLLYQPDPLMAKRFDERDRF
jgi:rhamnulokinase